MRMTRAALKAQTGAEEVDHHDSVKQGIVQIHQDSESTSDIAETDSLSSRSALRDITEENYPSDPFVEEKKKGRKGRGKKASSKVEDRQVGGETVAEEEPVVVREIETEEFEVEQVPVESQEVGLEAEERKIEVEPEIYIQDKAITKEDSFVDAIPSRSSAKYQAQSEESSRVLSFTDSVKVTPQRRTSSSFEESFEAMDSLEDNIEQLTESLPQLSTEEMPESPMKMTHGTPKSATPNISATRTPRTTKSTSKLNVSWNKENAPPSAAPNTPIAAKTPLIAKTSTVTQASPLKTKTPVASVRRPISTRTPARIVKSPVKTSATPIVATDRKTTTSPRRPTIKRPVLAQTTNTRSTPLPKKSEHNRAKSHGISLLSSPSKSIQVHKRRITSAVLSTARPGFIPSKSSKAPTTSTFMLPSEAIAEKLKAQKEAREERMKNQAPKLTPAEEKAARLKAEREAREERVRQNQMRESREVSGSFTLSSEAVAEKLRAQKEAREERMRTQAPKMTLAEEKAARLKAEREAREERVRQNQARESKEVTSVLASDAVAERLRVQKEAREERMKLQDGKALLASEKAAKLKAEREAREERVRENQRRAEVLAMKRVDEKNELNVNKVRLDISKARAEAAERGRLASREWAAKKKGGLSVTA